MLKTADVSNHLDKIRFLEILKNKFSPKKYNSILSTVNYSKELLELQSSLVDLQNWIQKNDKKVCIVFEGRDAAGKGGAIKRFTQHLNPRTTRVVALAKPTKKEIRKNILFTILLIIVFTAFIFFGAENIYTYIPQNIKNGFFVNVTFWYFKFSYFNKSGTILLIM